MSETKEATSKENKDITQTKEGSAPSPFSEFDRFFNEFKPFNWLKSRDWPSFPDFEAKAPKVDVIERDDTIVIRAEVPGISKEDLDISVSENSITLKGETKQETKEEKDNYIHSEIRRESFVRTVPLPCRIDAGNAKASMTDGVLELSLPKQEESQRTKISID